MPVRGPRAKVIAQLDDLSLSDDPLTRAMAPPPDETPGQRAERLRSEAEAKRISDMIDEELNRQRLAEKKGPKPVKILLLGEFRF
jgi:guanine nucleotide-binding protein subunit alpha